LIAACRAAGEHDITLKCNGDGTLEGFIEFVGAHVVGVRPHPQLWVVVESAGADNEIVKMVGAGRVACLGNGDTLVAIHTNGELAEYPPIDRLIIKNNRITVVV